MLGNSVGGKSALCTAIPSVSEEHLRVDGCLDAAGSDMRLEGIPKEAYHVSM